MLKKDNLLQLVNSLSPGEKKNFTLYTDIFPGDKRYLRLFTALQGKDVYDAKELCRQLRLKPQQLSDDKHHLSDVLLASLRNNIPTSHETDYLYLSIVDARGLMLRNLYGYALGIIDKSLANAMHLERFEVIDDLLALKFTCIHHVGGPYNLYARAHEEYTNINRINAEVAGLRWLEAEITVLENGRMPEEDFTKLMQHPLLKKDPEELLSIRAKMFWYVIQFKYFVSIGIRERTLEVASRAMEFYKSTPRIKQLSIVTYMLGYTNLADAEYEMGNYGKALDIINEFADAMQAGQLTSSKVRVNSFMKYVYTFRLQTLFKLGHLQLALKETEMAKADLQKFSEYERVSFFFYYAATLIHTGRAGEAIDRLNELMQISTEVRSDLQQHFRVLMIMAQIDLGNNKLVPYLIKSTKVWMRRNKFLNTEIDLFFTLIAPISKVSKAILRKKAYVILSRNIEENKLQKMEEYVSLQAWVKKHISSLSV